jgi:hypothetical protein
MPTVGCKPRVYVLQLVASPSSPAPPPNTHTHLVVWCQLLGAQFKHLNHSDADPAPRVLPLT